MREGVCSKHAPRTEQEVPCGDSPRALGTVLIMETHQRDFYDETFVFDNNMGLNFAIAFTAFDFEKEPILKESYGKLVFHVQEHRIAMDGKKFYLHEENLPTHFCTKEELGLEGNNSAFNSYSDK